MEIGLGTEDEYRSKLMRCFEPRLFRKLPSQTDFSNFNEFGAKGAREKVSSSFWYRLFYSLRKLALVALGTI